MRTPVIQLDINGRFARVNLAAITDKRVSNAALRVLAALGAYAGKKNVCWVGTRRIAAETGISQANIVRHIQKLRELGYVMSSQHQSPMSSQHQTDVTTTSPAMSSRHLSDVITPPKAMLSRHRNYIRELEYELERACAREPDQSLKNGESKKAEPVVWLHNPTHSAGCQCDACERCSCDACQAARTKSAALKAAKATAPPP